MAKITINEVDRSNYSSVTNSSTNAVFVPINSTWGPFYEPTLIRSTTELKSTFGGDNETSYTSGITSYEYATGILENGFSIVGSRITNLDYTSTSANLRPAHIEGDTEVFLKDFGTDQSTHIKRSIFLNAGEAKYNATKKSTQLIELQSGVTVSDEKSVSLVGQTIEVKSQSKNLLVATISMESIYPTSSRPINFASFYTSTEPTDIIPRIGDGYATGTSKLKLKDSGGTTAEYGVGSVSYDDGATLTINFVISGGPATGTYTIEEGSELLKYKANQYNKSETGVTKESNYESAKFVKASGEEISNVKVKVDSDNKLYAVYENATAGSTATGYIEQTYKVGDCVDAAYIGSFGTGIQLSFRVALNNHLYCDCLFNNTKSSLELGYFSDDHSFTKTNTSFIFDGIIEKIADWDVKESGTKEATETLTLVKGDDSGSHEEMLIAPEAGGDSPVRKCFVENDEPTDIADPLLYDVTFISNGGYDEFYTTDLEGYIVPSFQENMIDVAEKRSDSIAFCDIGATTIKSDVLTVVKDHNLAGSGSKYSFAATYAPWCYKTITSTGKSATSNSSLKHVPGSFVALTKIAKNFYNGTPIYKIPAGISRGKVSIDSPDYEIGQNTLNQWQPDISDQDKYSANPIMRIKNYGYCLFGQRTGYVNTTGESSALQELGCRLVVNEVKRKIREVALSLTFEANRTYTWNQFQAQVSSYLETLYQGGAIEAYLVTCDETTNGDEQIASNTVRGIVKIVVARSAENFDIDFEIYSGAVSLIESVTEA